MQILVLFSTIIGAAYFLLFEPDSPVAVTLMALAPLSWLGLFGVRFFSEKKKVKLEGQQSRDKGKKFIDPDALVEKSKKKEIY